MRWLLQRQIALFTKITGIDRPIVIVTVPTYARVALSLKHESVLTTAAIGTPPFRASTVKWCGPTKSFCSTVPMPCSIPMSACSRPSAAGSMDAVIWSAMASILRCSHHPARWHRSLSHLPRPLVVFFGRFAGKVAEFPLIDETAALRPMCSSYWAGLSSTTWRAAQRPNIHILPPCAHEQCPRDGVLWMLPSFLISAPRGRMPASQSN